MEEENKKQEIEKLLQQAKEKFTELDNEHGKFTELRSELQHKAVGIRNFYANSQNKESSIQTVLDTVTDTSNSIDETQQKVTQIYSDINTYYSNFETLREKLDDKEDGLKVNYEWIKEKREEASKKYQDIIKLQTESENLKTQIEEYKKQIEDLKDDSQELKSEIEKWLELVSDSARFNEFSKRKKQLQKEASLWLIVTVLGFFGLGLFVYVIFAQNPTADFISSLNKFFYTTPIIFLLLWSTKQYAETRLYLEKYAYKAITSVSLSSYLELLESKFGDDNEKLEDLAFKTINTIFKEPYKDKEKRQVINLFGGKVIYEDSEKIVREEEEDREKGKIKCIDNIEDEE